MSDITSLFQSLSQCLDLGIIGVDQNKRIIIYNKWVAERSAITESNALGKELSEIFPDINATRLLTTIDDALKHGLPAIVSNVFNRTPLPLYNNAKKTERINQNINIIPIKNENVQYCIIQINDISASVDREKALEQQVRERKEIEQELRITLRKLEDASKIKGEFLASMSHEIRTPINGIIGVTRLLKDTSPSSQQSEFLDIIDNSVQLLLTVINDILDFSKLEAGKLSLHEVEFDLEKTLNDVIALVKPSLECKNLKISNFIDNKLELSYLGDDNRIKQVILNLISNAIKFTDNGEIKVASQLIEANEHSAIIKISISDTGIGIDTQTQELLFDKFTQADSSTTRKYGGTGLGLAISKNIIELMHGSIGVESTPGQGSTFWINVELKRNNKKPVKATVIKKDKAAKQSFSGKVLLVEDVVVNQLIAKSFLKNIGFNVVIANNGQEALDMCADQEFKLIFMDCQMPVMDGFDATRHIREMESDQRTPIIALTALAMKDDAQLCFDAGMDDYITKPYELSDLITCIEKWV